MDRVLHNPGGAFDYNPKNAPLGTVIRITFDVAPDMPQEWATTKNLATAMMIVAALNRDAAIGDAEEAGQ